jgi:hypothetical protein
MLPLALAQLGISLAPQIYKGAKGIIQGITGDNLEKKDYTPPAFYEALGLGRQAATAALPGASQQLNRIEAGTNDTLAAASRAGTSGSSILSLLGTADTNRTRALADLATRTDADHQQKTRELGGLLEKKAGYETQNEQRYEAAKAALDESSQRNIYGAVDGASQVFTHFLQQAKNPNAGEGQFNSATVKGAGKKIAVATGTEATGIDDVLKPKRRYNRLGFEDPTGLYSA